MLIFKTWATPATSGQLGTHLCSAWAVFGGEEALPEYFGDRGTPQPPQKCTCTSHNRALLQVLFLPLKLPGTQQQMPRAGGMTGINTSGCKIRSTDKSRCGSSSPAALLFSPARQRVGRDPMESSSSHSRPLIAQHVSRESALGIRGWLCREPEPGRPCRCSEQEP